MELKYNAVGPERKRLVRLIAEIMECDVKYLGVPSCAYQVDCFNIDKNGSVHFDDMADSEEIGNLIERLTAEGFECISSHYDSEQQEPVIDEPEPLEDCPPPYGVPAQDVAVGLTVEMPLNKVVLGNLTNLLDAKGALIKKALGVGKLPIEISEETIKFPWFTDSAIDADSVSAYTHLIAALCEMSRSQKRISAVEKPVENEKYAFRCFLLRLGFIGAEYKAERKILLRNLSGNGAFKGGVRREISE